MIKLKSFTTTLAAMSALASPVHGGLKKIFHKKKPRPCLQCNHLHNHNNSWCSAECRRKFRQEYKREQ
ncbi:hypothetical protein [uncultured Endozoicomonas sp.]|uniref:hypothetical protein n=1 Tax=uncultured Endozoicomonas sp. TaxID=432652 RepID=UPI002620A8FB|nr:hypothetical protein [uncultured Endozoicomonas sp.]